MKKCVLTFLLGLTLIGICACANDTSKEATSSVETVSIQEVETVVVSETEMMEESETETTGETTGETTQENVQDNIPAAYKDIIDYTVQLINAIDAGDYEGREEGAFWELTQYAYGYGAARMRENLGYQVTDINGDGIDELVIAYGNGDLASGQISDIERAGYIILNVYTLDGEKAVLLADAGVRKLCFINSDGLFVIEHPGSAAYFDLWVYELEDKALQFKEIYHMYNDYLEDTMEVCVYESVNGGEAVLIDRTNDPLNSDIWEIYSDTVERYTTTMYPLDLKLIFSEEE